MIQWRKGIKQGKMAGNLVKWTRNIFTDRGKSRRKVTFASLFNTFQRILVLNNRILELMADMGDKLGGDYVFDRQYIDSSCRQMARLVNDLINDFNILAPQKYSALDDIFRDINFDIEEELAGRLVIPQTEYVMPYDLISRDFADVVGGKNANIAEVKNRLGLAAPEGFAVTTQAFKTFFEYNDLQTMVEANLRAWEGGEMSTEETSEKIMSLIRSGSIEPGLKKAVEKALKHMRGSTGDRNLSLAVRSSAMGEDSEHTFAGQYSSFLNITEQDFLKYYREVLASAYSPNAMEYRKEKGFSIHEVAMAVACQNMIDALVSGVIYSMDPIEPSSEVMVISATWGLGAPVVSGEINADRFIVSREHPYEVKSFEVVRKPKRLVAGAKGECEFQPVSEEMQTTMSLTEEQVRGIAEAGLMIERYFKCPQDIEWSIDQNDQLHILQARPLNIKSRMSRMVCDISTVSQKYPVIFSGKGIIVQNGIASGRVFMVQNDSDLNNFPNGAILVARETSPRFAKVAKKASAIITDIGTSTGHMATISREFRIPTIVNTDIATASLKPGQEITLDAQENVVYEGRIQELCYYGLMEDSFEESYEYRMLRRVLKRITPLNMVDPHDKNFNPSGCRTYHDITRFIHEKAVEELVYMDYANQPGAEAKRKKLESGIPLDLVIIDIKDGLKGPFDSSTVTLEQIQSVPMCAFLEGLNAPGAWSREPMPVDFGGFMSSLTRTFSSHHVNPQYVGQNLAVISTEYANINLRLGYHFNLIDAYIGEQINDNYAYFRFMGGVTDPVRRSRRAKFIYEVLAQNDFNVDLSGDLVIGRIKKLRPQIMQKKMTLLGQMVGFTRQLDMRMNSDQQIIKFIKEFETLTKTDNYPKGLRREAQ
jgi:pyruvate,water dikinase